MPDQDPGLETRQRPSNLPEGIVSALSTRSLRKPSQVLRAAKRWRNGGEAVDDFASIITATSMRDRNFGMESCSLQATHLEKSVCRVFEEQRDV